MYISRLVLDHYRSWDTCLLDLEPGVTIIKGRNGLGKTNLVEAIEVLSTGTSHRVSSSLPLVERGRSKATVRARIQGGEDPTDYELTITTKGAKRGRINGGPSLYMRDMVGKVPCVTFSPDDQRMVSGEPLVRRSFLDEAGALLDPDYFRSRQNFAHIAQQRSALLKQLLKQGDRGTDQRNAVLSGLEIWTGQFIQAGLDLTRRRMSLVAALAGPFETLYSDLAGPGQEANLDYVPSLDEIRDQNGSESAVEEAISEHFQRIYPGEVARGTNLIGPQRDDLVFGLNGMQAREFASNGEMWTLALALRLALFEVIVQTKQVRPIVVLDDVFAQLDEGRRSQILAFAGDQDQVLITVAADGDIPSLDEARLVDVESLKADAFERDQDEEISRALADLTRARSGQDGDRT